nr:class I SAM-dependent methyltransferase [Methylobacterium sp. OTU13CASTA1]
MIHIDAGHDYRAVMSDLEAWWPLVRPGGWVIGDDYVHDGHWPGVRQAFDEFYQRCGLFPFEHGGAKCRIQKPT